MEKKSSSLRKRDPAFVSCAPSPAEVRAISVKGYGAYHGIEVSCPFCGAYHNHSGGQASGTIVYGSRIAPCQKGTYTILPSE
jgi:hypothetical protein